jgi:hypothetical protein
VRQDLRAALAALEGGPPPHGPQAEPVPATGDDRDGAERLAAAAERLISALQSGTST